MWTGGSFIHEGCEPTSLPVTIAQVILLSTKFPLVLHFQLNEQRKVKALRVAGTDSTVKGGLGVVQIIGEGLCL